MFLCALIFSFPNAHLETQIAAFVNATRPTAAETETVHRLLEEVGRAGRRLWHTARVALFGSQAHGLALPGSDLDIVVLGLPLLTNKDE
jgi:DNA polymerase sigma